MPTWMLTRHTYLDAKEAIWQVRVHFPVKKRKSRSFRSHLRWAHLRGLD
jgi:hypothetical protein